MKANIGNLDRTVRILLGLVLIVLAGMGIIGVWGWIGLLPLATGLARFCPVYAIAGWRTCSAESDAPVKFHDDLPVQFHTDPRG